MEGGTDKGMEGREQRGGRQRDDALKKLVANLRSGTRKQS